MAVTANVLERVLFIRNSASLGTGFTIESSDQQYLVTAAHIVSPTDHSIEVWCDAGWLRTPIDVLPPLREPHDVAVMRLAKDLTPRLPLVPTSEAMLLGQDAYFLGYPLGEQVPLRLSSGQPLPLVKKGVVSAFYRPKGASHLTILLDGFNVPGFSGGPVVFLPRGTTEFRVAGVISGYQARPEPVYRSERATDLHVRANTGIVIAWDIAYAMSAISGVRAKSASADG